MAAAGSVLLPQGGERIRIGHDARCPLSHEGRPSYAAARKLPMVAIAERITVNPRQCGGRPCVRGMRIRLTDVLDLLAAGLSVPQVLEELPDLEPEDVAACLRYASRRLDHPILAA